MFWWAISQTSITDRSSEASSSCSQSVRLKRMPFDDSLKHLFSSNCNAELSYCANKRLSQAVNFSPETAMSAGSVQHSTAVPTHSHRVNKKLFNCYLCGFTCSWAFDLSLHLRKKHGVHKKLWAFAKLWTHETVGQPRVVAPARSREITRHLHITTVFAAIRCTLKFDFI